MKNNTQEKRVLCVGKVHADWVSLKVAPQPKAPRILTEAEMQAAAEDYEGDMDDRARHARGQW